MKPIFTQATVRSLPMWAISQASTLYNKTGTWRNFRPVYDNKIPPCNDACPAGAKIQAYIDLISQSRHGVSGFQSAWELIKQDNPLPAVCGRVCFHPCETACNRSQYDEPIAIHNIERLIGDYGLMKNLRVKGKKVKSRKRIAIIGGGPAGLTCAYHLARLGYRPTILEASGRLGGMLMNGIPTYRLPKNILQKEIDSILRLGINVEANLKVGRDKSLEAIYKKYNAVFIATGAHKERRLNIAGEDNAGVIPALRFLHEVNLGRKVRLGRNVAVIGGGNAAIDAARSAARLGAKPVVVYRRTRNEMPAIPDEIKDAEEEKLQFIFLAAPIKIITRERKIIRLECQKMRLGKTDASGRRKPIPIKGATFQIKIDTIIPAIGEEPDLSFLSPNIKVTERAIQVNETGATKLAGVFAGGDAVTGPKTVVEAIGAGKKAAFSIDRYLRKEKGIAKSETPGHIVSYEELNTAYFEPARRTYPSKLALLKRKRGFKEVYQKYSQREMVTESSRCFSCGVCNRCDNCFVFCPDMAVIKKNEHYEFNYDYCKGCAVCVTECPRNAISLVEEKR